MKLDTLGQLHAERARSTVTDATLPPIDQIIAGRKSGRMVAALAWTAVAAAAVVVAALVASPAPDLTPTTLLPISGDSTTTTAASTTTTTMVSPLGAWNPILATTRAKPAPAAATCPPGSNPEIPGRVDQERPQPGPWSNQAAAFNRHTGRIIFVDEAGETWTFDVCTNTWQNMKPQSMPTWQSWSEGELVYDTDSDLTISFGRGAIAVYDANANTWTQRDQPPEYATGWWAGAVYDPVSGLVVVQNGEAGPVAYNVDTDQWTPLGTLWCSRYMVYDPDTEEWTPAELVRACSPFLIGYSAGIDRLIFLQFQGDGQVVDPRTGEYTHLDEPPGGVMGGFGSFSYATGGVTAYTFSSNYNVCRLDPVAQNWECHPRPFRSITQMPSAMVADPINNRLVVFNDFCCNWPGTKTTKDIWALDLDTGEWTQLLASISP